VGTLKAQSNGPLYSNTLAVDNRVYVRYSEEGTGWAVALPNPLLSVLNVRAQPTIYL